MAGRLGSELAAGALGEAAARVSAVGCGRSEAAGGRTPEGVGGPGRSHTVVDTLYDRARVHARAGALGGGGDTWAEC